MTPQTRLYQVCCKHHNVETFWVRATSPEEAKDAADCLVEGRNLIPYDAEVLQELEDDGREVDNDA